MNKELVIVVATEEAASRVAVALEALDVAGSIELYSSTIVAKSRDGKLEVENVHRHAGPWRTLLGLSSGALVGLLGGPVGAAVGAAIGGAAGLGGDLAVHGFTGDFVAEVAKRLEPGKYAVCATVWEDWAEDVDGAVAPFGAVVFRVATDDVVVARIAAEMQAMKEEQDQLAAEIQSATGDAKKKIEARRDELRAKHDAERERLQARAEKLQARWKAELASIDAKMSKARAEAKARHQRHRDKLSSFTERERESLRIVFGP
jgi:uncharacterized membrane protein